RCPKVSFTPIADTKNNNKDILTMELIFRGLIIFLIRYRPQPYRSADMCVGTDGDMCHGLGRCRSVPVCNIWRTFHYISLFYDFNGLSFFLIQAFPFGHQKYLATLVMMPVCPCARFESN